MLVSYMDPVCPTIFTILSVVVTRVHCRMVCACTCTSYMYLALTNHIAFSPYTHTHAPGIDMLTNVQRGHVYGDVSGWSLSRRRQLGVHLLYKAFLSYKLHPPQQIYHGDL